MFRYMAWIWNTASQDQSDVAELLSRRLRTISPQWQDVFHHAGMRVVCADSRPDSLAPRLMARDAGVVMGNLFERNTDPEDPTPSRKVLLDTDATESIVRSQGNWLVTRCWGDYVAFVSDAHGRFRWVIKDPVGNLPCFCTPFRGLTVFFSCIADCLDLQLLSFTINPSYLNRRLVDGGCSQEHSPLLEAAHVHRGECVEIDPAMASPLISRRFLWTPLRFSNSNALLDDPNRAARAMRATVHSATHSLASCHASLLLRLSGGLDSSIINGCLKAAPTMPHVTCYTHFNPRGRLDERPWARLAAGHSGFEHVEYPIVPEQIDLRGALQMPPSVEPASVLEFLQRTSIEAQLAPTRRATAILTGDGGDSGFCSDSISHALSEYFHLRGFNAGAVRLASQIALLTELSTWTVLLCSLRRWHAGASTATPRDDRLKACRLVNPALVAASIQSPQTDHPWFQSEERVRGGIARRVGGLAGPAAFYNAAADANDSVPEIVSPLYSQPVVELLLRIPIHTHFEGGQDRGLARRAFALDVPRSILQRRWKDRAPGFHDELVHVNHKFLRALFLDGVLVGEGLLDRCATEAALSTAPNKSQVCSGEIIGHMGTELWARHWMALSRVARLHA